MNTSSIPQLFEAVQLAVYNVKQNKNLQSQLNSVGITSKKVQEGDTLLQTAQQVQGVQEQHYDEARTLSVQITEDRNAAYEVFKDHAAIAKTAFRKEPHIIRELNILNISASGWTWTKKATSFYDKAAPYMEKL